MSTAYGTVDQAAASRYQYAQQPLAQVSGQQFGESTSYVGVHRRPGSRGPDPDSAQRQPGHRPRHGRSGSAG
jgi:hypothetical protein